MYSLPNGVDFLERGWLSSNSILLQDLNQAILVDSGYWTHAKQTYSLVTRLLKEKPLTKLINTHLHSDHCGGNAYFQKFYPKVEICIPASSAKSVDDWNIQKLRYSSTGQYCPSFRRTGLSLHNGDTILVNDKVWHIYTAPGHDPNSVIIFNECDGILISADALWENGFGVVFPEIEGFNAFDEIESTLNIIENLQPKLVLPGHGSPFSNVSDAINHARSRLEQFRKMPDKHAIYAAKVLLKFKLLELQKIRLPEFLLWGESTEYLQLLFKKYSVNESFDTWFFNLCKKLHKSGACFINDEYIINLGT